MNSLYDSIKQGLIEAIEYECGNLPSVKVDKITIAPIRIYSSGEIKAIRIHQCMTQKIFAKALGVSIKTVEAWEAGTNRPSGIANRMLELLTQDNELLERCSVIARN